MVNINKTKYITCLECGHEEFYDTIDGDYQLCKNCMTGLNIKKEYDYYGYEIPDVWSIDINRIDNKVFFTGYTYGRNRDDVNFYVKDLNILKHEILKHEAYEAGYILNEKCKDLTIDEFYKEFKPIAIKLFELFYDFKYPFQPTHFTHTDYEIMNTDELRSHLNGDFFYVCDRWSPERLNRILEQMFLIFEKQRKAEDGY